MATCMIAGRAEAHASQQAFVLLLPTDFYIRSGTAAVLVTVLLLALPRLGRMLTATPHLIMGSVPKHDLATLTSLMSFAFLVFLLAVGVFGSRDPLANLLPLVVWTIWWVGFLVVQALLGDLWHWLNPWTGIYRVLVGRDHQPRLKLPARIAQWPAVVGFLMFAFFMLAHLSPEDPHTLAVTVSTYWAVTLTGMLLFGQDAWLSRCECFTILLRAFAKLSVFATVDKRLAVGVPGWRIRTADLPSISGAVFILAVFGISSFDGLNETFWWLVTLDINPLEFPGRSAIAPQTMIGAIAAILVLVALFAASLFAGLALVRETGAFQLAFQRFSLTILPIAVGYHIAHFLPTLLVNAQYALAAASDPWTTGADYLGLGTFYVTTGFFNHQDTVRVIFLTQAAAVVIGHILSLLSAHAVATELFGSNRRAVISQIPLAGFMVAYTTFGLWLLATPRGA